MFRSNLGWSWLVPGLLLSAVGCGNTSAEGIETTTEAIGTECANASSTAVFNYGFSVTSPQTYDTLHCYKGQVYDVLDYEAHVGLDTPTPTLTTLVRWADTPPTVSACADAWVHSDLFVNSLGSWSYVGSKSGYGVVIRGVACHVPAVLWATEMQPGERYRVTATARTSSASSAPTRKVLTETLANGSPDLCLDKIVQDTNPCTADACDPLTGTVTHTPVPGGVKGGPDQAVAGGSGVLCP